MPRKSRSSGAKSRFAERTNKPTGRGQIDSYPSNPSRLVSKSTAWFAGLMVSFMAYLYWYLSQPSFFAAALQAMDEQDPTRFVDLFIFPSAAVSVLESFPGGLDRLPYISLGLGWLVAAAWIGWPLVRCVVPVKWHGSEASSRSSRLVAGSLSVLVGLSLLSTAVLLVGLAGGLGSRVMLLVAVASMLAAADCLRRIAPKPSTIEGEKSDIENCDAFAPENVGMVWACRLVSLATIGMAAFYTLGSLVPPWEFDVLEYHLQAPKEFYQSGRIDFVPHNVYANMPLGVEMHSLAMMVSWGGDLGWWHGAIAGKLITGLHALLTAALVGGFVTQRHGSYLGWFCAALTLTMPGNAHVSFAGLIDTALGAYVLAGFICLFFLWHSRRVNDSGAVRFQQVVAMACLSGAACACKYPGLLFAVIPAGVVLTGYVWRTNWKPSKALVAFSLGLALTCLPWFIRNAIQCHNPVFPIAHSVFGGRGLSEDQVARWSRVHSPSAKTEMAPFSAAALWRDVKQVAVVSPFTNVALNFFSILSVGVLVHRFRASKHFDADWLWLLAVVWIFGLWWCLTHRIDRFWLPAVPLMSILAGVGTAWTARVTSSSMAISVLALWVYIGSLAVLAGVHRTDRRIFVPLAKLEEETLKETPDSHVSQTTAWVNQNLDSEDKLLAIGEAKGFLYRVPIVYGTCFNDAPGERFLRGKSAKEQRENLAREKLTHVMVDWAEIGRYRGPGNYGFSDWPTKADINAMVEAGILNPVENPFSPDLEVFEVALQVLDKEVR